MANDDLNINITGNAKGLKTASGEAKTSLGGVADSAKAIERAFKVVGSAIDPTFAALTKYNNAQKANAELLKAGIIDANAWANAQVKLRDAYDQTVAAIHRRSEAGKAEAAQTKADKAAQLLAEKAAAAEAKRLASEVAAAKKKEARDAAAAERAAIKATRDEARAAAAEAKRLARETRQAEAQANREATEAIKQAKRDQTAANRAAAAAAKQAAKDAREASRLEARAAREAADAVRDKARAEKQASQAASDLRASIDPAYAAQTRYNQTMQTATQLLMQNKLKTGEWAVIQKQARAQMDLNVRSLGRQNAMYVQLGYQAQDVTASLASGINPLVILAQQGGQTAAALSTMGGTVGRVASFFAGPWGAAIIGFTLLLGYMMKSSEDAKEATVDLMNAESRRKASLEKLTDAIKEFTKAQREANTSEEEGLRLKGLMTSATTAEQQGKLVEAEAKVASLKNQIDNLKKNPLPGEEGALLVLIAQLNSAEKLVTKLKGTLRDLSEGQTELDITNGIKDAEAATDALTRARRDTQLAMDKVNNDERIALNYAREHMTGEKQRLELQRISNLALSARVNLTNNLRLAEAKLNEEKKKAPKEETYSSRQSAIGAAGHELQKAGYSVGENFQFGKVGQHPGMGRQAHGQFAIDVNMPGYSGGRLESADPVAKAKMDTMVKTYVARGFRVLWNGKVYEPNGGPTYDIPAAQNQHKDHAHIEAPKSIVGKPTGKGLGGQLVAEAQRQADEAQRIEDEARRDAHDAAVAELEFQQTLAGEDLARVAELQEQKITLIKGFYGENSREAIRASRELILINRRKEQQVLADTKASLEAQLNAAMETEQARADVIAAGRDINRDNVDAAESSGMISPEQARLEKARILDEEYRDQVEHEAIMYQLKVAALRATLALQNLPLDEARRINQQIEQAQTEHLNKMRGLNLSYEREVNQVRNASFAAQAAKWRDMASTISGSMRQAFQGIWTHQTTFQQTMINMADAIVYKFADMGAKMLEDWMVKQAVKLGLIPAQQAAETAAVAAGEASRTGVTAAAEATRTGIGMTGVAAKGLQETVKTGAVVAGEAVQTGAKVAGEATRTSVGAAGAVAEIGTRAATSAAGAFSSTVVIPFIGPVAAPVAAAAALAAVLGFAALVSARGGQERVPMDGQITELHKDEMVLPAWMANPFREQLRNPQARTASMNAGAQAAASKARAEATSTSSGRGDINFHYEPKHTNMGASFDTLLKKDGASLRRWMRNEIRNGGLNLG